MNAAAANHAVDVAARLTVDWFDPSSYLNEGDAFSDSLNEAAALVFPTVEAGDDEEAFYVLTDAVSARVDLYAPSLLSEEAT